MLTKQCVQCSKTFQITEVDLVFYKKITVPTPTFCPQCRNQRRMSWRNDRSFYQRSCDLTGEKFISMYPAQTSFPVYKPSSWYGDGWDPLSYGQPIDWNRPFFEQWHDLMLKVPRLGIDIVNCENSDYCNYCGDDKNCYLDIAGEANEDCYYNLFTKYSKNCADCTFVYSSELCYEAINCYNCHNVRYSMYLENCYDCAFSFDLRGCNNCLFSTNLRNKQYYIFNKSYTQEQYTAKLKEFQFGSYAALQKNIKQWQEVMSKAIHRYNYSIQSEDCSGNDIKNSHTTHEAFNVSNCENSKYLYDVLNAKDCYDLNYSLYDPEGSYELISTLQLRYSAFSMASHYCSNIVYCDQCNNSSDLFGCIGLNKQRYCILNKQYSETEYKKLKEQLIDHMEQTGEWGQFFPSSLSPFAYNETVAQEYLSLTQVTAQTQDLRWKETDVKQHHSQTVTLSDNIKDIESTISKEILACSNCSKNYRIIPQELELYKKLLISLPRLCPDCRHHARLQQRNPRQLWQRQCMCTQPDHKHQGRCATAFETTYSPERKELIYCEQCYQKEMY